MSTARYHAVILVLFYQFCIIVSFRSIFRRYALSNVCCRGNTSSIPIIAQTLDENFLKLASSNATNSYSSEEMKLRALNNTSLVHCRFDKYPNVDIYLCGTIHVSKMSTEMVREVIKIIQPNAVMIELCRDRFCSLMHSAFDRKGLGFRDMIDPSSLILTMLIVMQRLVSKITSAHLGGEFVAAVEESCRYNIPTLLGDRPGELTHLRLSDQIGRWESIKFFFGSFLSMFNVKKTILKYDTSPESAKTSMNEFKECFPTINKIIIEERNEWLYYMLEKLSQYKTQSQNSPIKIVAVIGNAHVEGMRALFERGATVTRSRIIELSSVRKYNESFDVDELYFVNLQSIRMGLNITNHATAQ